jgi:hypothetical protein
MRRRIEPKTGHALFFPDRRENQIVIGDAVNVWIWQREEFKHVQLGYFKVEIKFSQAAENPPAKTSDDLPCDVHAIFRIAVNEDIDSLNKSTRDCSVSKNLEVATVSHGDFKKFVTDKLEILIEESVRKVAYTDLFKKAESAIELESSIRTKAEEDLTEIGFSLQGCRVDIVPQAPTPEALAKQAALQNLWSKHLETKRNNELEVVRRHNDFEEKRKKEENRSKLVREKEDSEYEVDRQKELNKREDDLRKLRLTNDQAKLKVEEEKAKISGALQLLNDEIQRKKDLYEHERRKLNTTHKLDEEQHEAKRRYDLELENLDRRFHLNQLKREEEANERENALVALEDKRKLAELEVHQADMQQKLAEIKHFEIEKLGKVEAEIQKLKVLAEHAHNIEMNQALLEALPAILEKAYIQSDKLGEVKIMYIGGGSAENVPGSSAKPIDQVIGTILSSMSTIPMLREVLQFLNKSDLIPADSLEIRKTNSMQQG